MTKKELRTEIRSRVNALAYAYKKESSKKISGLVFSMDEYKNADSIFVYSSSANEPDTSAVIEKALADGKRVYVPRCISKGIMVPVPVDRDTQYEQGYMGIKEPVFYDEDISLSEIDLSVIPCMSAAPDGKRLGHGAGFYDIFLSNTKTYKLCLCFHELLSEHIPTDAHDIKMDCIITENGIFRV